MNKFLAFTFVCLGSVLAFGQGGGKAALKADADAVKSACSAEATAANCGDKAVGTGLLKCLGEHRKANKEFKVSEGCKSAMKTLRKDRKQLRAERAEKKAKQ